MRERAYAKLNLLLRVIGRREDGFHDLCMVNCSITIFDELEISPSDAPALAVAADASFRNLAELPTDGRNIALKALMAACTATGSRAGWKISLTKSIPMGAGLAGGSTDAAAVLRMIGRGIAYLPEIALKLGADVPFCLSGAPAVVTGIGEHIRRINLPKPLHFVIVNPGFQVSTKEIFEAWRKYGSADVAAPDELVRALEAGEIENAARFITNGLQPVTAKLYPVVDEILSALRAMNPLAAMMSGSGPTCFGIFRNEEEARRAADRLRDRAEYVSYAESVIPEYADGTREN